MHPGAAVSARVMTVKRVETSTATSERGGKCEGSASRAVVARDKQKEGAASGVRAAPTATVRSSKDKGPRATRQTACPDRRHRRVPDVLLLVPHHPAEL